MPIYEYACEKCHHVFDALQKMDAEPLRECPECGEPALKKLLSAPNFRLKGGGWYETDFKKDNRRNIAGDGENKPDKKPDKKEQSDKPDTKKTGSGGTDGGSSKKSGDAKAAG